ncbi:MAG: Lrp/AsnC family transcriptional regulator [Candidatus Bathyarchaeota archaeon]
MMDEVDVKILKELVKNSRQSFREIAKKLDMAVGTVVNRVRNLEKTGVIKGYSVVVDHEKLGYELTAIIEVTVAKGKLLEVDEKVAKEPTVCAVYDTTGVTDAIVIAKFKTREDLSKFVKNLLSNPYVERTNTHIVLTTVKEDYGIL